MNISTIFRSSSLALLVTCLSLHSCKKTDGYKAPPDTKTFHPDIFRQNMVVALGNNPIGYTFTVNHNGNLVDSASQGFARMVQDGSRKHTIMNTMNIASITKYLTAVCAVRVLQERGIALDSPVYPYLPSFWKPSTGAKNVTFHDLLRHRTGLTTDSIRYGTDYQGLKDCFENPIANPAKGYNYSNVNFAIFRIMMAYLDNKQNALSVEAGHMANGDTLNLEKFLVLYYTGRMDEKVFKPSGVSGASVVMQNRAEETLYYSASLPTLSGRPAGDWTYTCGGGGYYLSPYELAKILAYINHSEKVLTSAQRQLMENNLYGFDSGESPATAYGPSYGKDGALVSETNGLPGVTAGDRGMQTIFMKLPAGVEVVLYVNSIGDGWNFGYPNMIKAAYEGAWK